MRLLFKLQILSAVSVLHVDVLSLRHLHVIAVLHQVLDGKSSMCLSDFCVHVSMHTNMM